MALRRAPVDVSYVHELARALEPGAIRAVYQPVVDLRSGETIGYEALARGPLGSALERPAHLLAAARAAGRLGDLDWACRAAAARGALEAGLREPLTLFVNVEPAALHEPVPPAFKALWARAEARLRVVLDVTERALTDAPTELLWSIEWARERGWGVALDDVGGDPRSLALLPLLRPDVVKLDPSLLRSRSAAHGAEVVDAVGAESERTGAAVLAEGVETPEARDLARARGARLGQGWLLGRPRALPGELPWRCEPVPMRPRHWDVPVAFTPYDVLSARRPELQATKRTLRALSRSLEREALAAGERSVVLSAFQEEPFFTAASRRVYEELARRSSFVAALGAGMPMVPARGVRGAGLSARDPLRREWVVAVVGRRFAAALAGRDLGDGGPDDDRRFDYALTYDRDLVVQVALGLMVKVIAA